MKTIFPVLLVLIVCACTTKTIIPSAEPKTIPSTLEEAVSGPWRTDSNRVRDRYRHPVETLNFFGVKPSMTVVEISPATGWFTEILAPFLAANGKYIAAVSSPQEGPNKGQNNPQFVKWMETHPSVASKVSITKFNLPAEIDIAPSESADLVLTFINLHNWMETGHETIALTSFFRALKPGGILGVVQHRSDSKVPQDPRAKNGYVREDYLIKLAKKVGFKLIGRSEINSNSSDTKDYPDGVWTLPPTLKLGEKDKEKYLAIGESDKMTLKFVRPH